MPTNPFGSGVSRYITDRDRQYSSVIFQASKPPLDSELNLISLIDLESKAEEVRSRVPSGWLMNELNPRGDFKTSQNYSNYFYLGRESNGEVRNINWAVVNGWLIPVAATRTGNPPLAPNDVDYWNKILLNPPPNGVGGNVPEFVFLEVWLQRIDVDPPPPSTTKAPGKPLRGFIYRFGNVESGTSYLPDELVDPDINYETTKRVQIQYRVRVVQNVGLSNHPEGFDPTMVFAQGALAEPSIIPFSNMRRELGDAGLWRAGTGDSATFGTADGFVYAIPLCAVWRRNSATFSPSNLAGAFNRNSLANTRNDTFTYSAGISLPAALSDTASSFTLTSISGTVLARMGNFSEAFFKIDEEIVAVSSVVMVSPTNYTVNIVRGVLGSTPRSHVSGSTLQFITTRPDGLFSDQIASTDILDLRHSVADKFDYDSILKTNIVELLKGNLRSTWKSYGAAASQGAVVLYGDRITDATSNAGLSKLDAPDGLRRTWSDSIVTQHFAIPIRVPTVSDPLNVSLSATLQVAPYQAVIQWSSSGSATRNVGILPYWWNGDTIRVLKSQFTNVSGILSDQFRFMLPTEYENAVLVRFDGMTSDPNGGAPSDPATTSPTASNPNIAYTGKRILKPGDGLTVTEDPITGDLLIQLSANAVGTSLSEWTDALQTITTASDAERLPMWVEFTVVYGAGRGLSHKPDYIHSAIYDGNPPATSRSLLRQGQNNANPMIPVSVVDSPYVQTGNDRTYAKTSEVMVDAGSKSIYVAPYTYQTIPNTIIRDGSTNNWYYDPGLLYQGLMPQYDIDHNSIVHPVVDPLNLFKNLAPSQQYVEIPLDLLPKPGLHYVPIVPTTAASLTFFSSGINFILSAQQGTVSASSVYNPNLVSYPAHPGYYICTPTALETYGTTPAGGPYSVFGEKVTVTKISSSNGTPFTGIRFPPYYGPARITGIYERTTSPVQYEPTATPFNADREYVNPAGSSVNLLKDSFDGPTFLLDVDENNDLTFILNSEVIDYTRASAGSTFSNREYMIECVLFGFDRGFLQTNGRMICTNATGAFSPTATENQFTENAGGIGIITPAPLASGGSTNQLTLYYSRSPYQGNPFGSQYGFGDDPQRVGPLTTGQANQIFSNPLGPVNTLTLPNKTGLEVLSALSFTTDLGTGRLSGSNPIPLLNQTEAPLNPPDYAGTRIDMYRRLSLNRVGYEDWVTPKFPVDPSTITDPLEIKTYALSEVYDNDVHPEFAGCVVQLPLGAYFRDKDFIGKTLYQSRASNNNASIPVGALSFMPYEAPITKGAQGVSTWEGTEFVCGNASNTTGVGSEAIVRVDGIDNRQGSASFTSVTTFKTARGAAAYSATGPWPGGVISSRFPKSRPNSEVGAVLNVSAFLVRSSPETVSGIEVHPGNELQMLVVTHAVPAYFRDNEILHSASGLNEGYTAVERYRLLGKPLEKRRASVDLNVLPANPPLFVNKIYDNPLFYGSSDLPLVSVKQETATVTSAGQTSFSLSQRPLEPTSVQMYLNGVKLQYGAGADYTVSGATNQTVTYYPSYPVHPPINLGDVVEFWYVVY